MSKITPKTLLLVLILVALSCQTKVVKLTSLIDQQQAVLPIPVQQQDTTIYTAYSAVENTYLNFNASKAIDTIADIENEYFRKYNSTETSQYYGTAWRTYAESVLDTDVDKNLYEDYIQKLDKKGDSMHCTIYAVAALRSGLEKSFDTLQYAHKKIWNNREYAGWSIGYLLVKNWNWKAYLVIDRASKEFDQCQKAFLRKKEYPVWKQPNIKLEALYIRGQDDAEIKELLTQNEFGWGFSHQGIHTWITRFDVLKECNWMGAPRKKYETSPAPLFLKTPFMEYNDYASHIIIFPPKNNK